MLLNHAYMRKKPVTDPTCMCSLVVSVLDSPAVDPRSNPGSGSALLMSEKSQAVNRQSALQ